MRLYYNLIFTILTCLLFEGCISIPSLPSHIPEYSEFRILDFTPYTEQGFLFTPDKYNGEYESIGIVRYEFVPSQNLVTKEGKYNSVTGYSDPSSKEYVPDEYNIQDGLEQVFLVASDMGANAVINLSVESIEVLGNANGYRINGFAINRIFEQTIKK